MTELHACERCNTVYWRSDGQNKCYNCGHTNFHEVSETALTDD